MFREFLVLKNLSICSIFIYFLYKLVLFLILIFYLVFNKYDFGGIYEFDYID